jgi:diguanylate cyclase (GGDEF)-like protein/PAS domain S-box-containing protein
MKNEQFLASIADHVPGLVAVYNIQTGEYLYVNKSVTKILGYQPEDFINGGINFTSSLMHPDDAKDVWEKNSEALDAANKNPTQEVNNDSIVGFEYRLKHKDGSWVWMHTEGSVFSRDKNGMVENILNISVNITERKIKEDQLATLKSDFEKRVEQQKWELLEREDMFKGLIEVIQDYAIFRLDLDGKVVSWNEGIENILGYTEEEIIGKPLNIIFTQSDQLNNMPQKELDEVKVKGALVQEGIRVRKDGTTFFAVSTITPIKNEMGELQGFSKIIRDVTELKEAEETIRYHALHDTLTGLANRKALDEHFSVAQSLAMRHGHKVAIMFLDLDRFKTINDTLGHGIGDLVLKEVALRLRNSTRNIDIVARLGGDEFIILLNDIYSSKNVMRVADKIMESLAPVIRVGDQSLHITASIGIAMFPTDGQDVYTLLKNADTALYRAKDAGRNRYQFYDYSMNLQSSSLLSLEQDLRTAVSKNEFFMEYQPFIDMKTGKVLGAEALVRWQHPTLGVLSPGQFIPLAEETGMIVPIGKWILQSVCKQGKQFAELGYPLKITVNLSARQFAETSLVDTVTEILDQTQFKPADLELEITESVAMENINRTSSKLTELKEHGMSIAIDDFGTGYSSLSYLKRFPVQKLKIDKSFVKHAITDQQDSSIIQAIIFMGQSMGLSVCAEGVEEKAQLELLTAMGCDIAQGYLISKPVRAEILLDWLKSFEMEQKIAQP